MDPILLLLCLYLFLAGACIGSFLNVCVYRVPRSIPVWKGRSFCPACGHALGVLDLIPLLGYLTLKGRCRYCGGPISPRYPLVEALTGGLFLLAFFTWGLTLRALAGALFFCVLLVAALIDWDTGEIPDRLSVFLVLLSPLYILSAPGLPLWQHAAGALAVGLPLLLMALLGGFGGGDVKLAAACGLLLGWKLALLGAFFAVLGGGLYGGVLLLRKQAKRGDTFSFGPFLCGGMALACAFGNQLLFFYWGLFR